MESRTGRTLALILPVFFMLLSGSAGGQQSTLAGMLDSLEGAHGIRQVAISPDGQRVAWVEYKRRLSARNFRLHPGVSRLHPAPHHGG